MKLAPTGTKAKKSNTGLIIGIIVIALLVLGVGGYFIITRVGLGPMVPATTTVTKVDCLQNLKTLNLAAVLYGSDHNNLLPDASQWVQQMDPYIKQMAPDRNILKCPDDHSSAITSYAMNSNVSGKNADDFLQPKTVIFYETANPGANPSGTGTDIADPPRHPGGSCYAFVGGAAEQSATKPQF
jgi:hypothetical protein